MTNLTKPSWGPVAPTRRRVFEAISLRIEFHVDVSGEIHQAEVHGEIARSRWRISQGKRPIQNLRHLTGEMSERITPWSTDSRWPRLQRAFSFNAGECLQTVREGMLD